MAESNPKGPRSPDRDASIGTLETLRSETFALISRIQGEDLTSPGIGGGSWSLKDLLAHLESWEQHVLDAIEAWSHDRPAPIDARLYQAGLNRLNADELARRATRSFDAQMTATIETRATLLTALRLMTEVRWNSPATSRARLPLGHRVGQLLVGKKRPFGHDEAHLSGLREFVLKIEKGRD